MVLDGLSLVQNYSQPFDFVKHPLFFLVVLLPPPVFLLSSRIFSWDLSFGIAFLHLRIGRKYNVALHQLLQLLVAPELGVIFFHTTHALFTFLVGVDFLCDLSSPLRYEGGTCHDEGRTALRFLQRLPVNNVRQHGNSLSQAPAIWLAVIQDREKGDSGHRVCQNAA